MLLFKCIFVIILGRQRERPKNAAIAQLDRVLDYESRG